MKKLKNTIEELIDFDITEQNNIGIENLMFELENKGLINFQVGLRETQNDLWLQAEYWNKTIKKTIIISYDFPDSFDDVDELVNQIKQIKNEIKEISKIIKIIWKKKK